MSELWRLSVAHEGPPPKGATLARAALCRAMHGLDEHNVIELIEEYSEPHRCAFTLRADELVREGLAIVVDGMYDGVNGVTTAWERREEP